eukprot:CAMPEP_0185261842 /NCGR_PEP_ID=MMETSP1359-20130426/10153_1 /TAXON_ID=552665 /ORGANISM="Bigelowiella longifila, Strain CCMP242" /LENGTH=385 /DNA_ID=CAMNT_0027848605 /DNA_START=192 /DNA_END=1346 /DNA_ORIENTATION=+
MSTKNVCVEKNKLEQGGGVKRESKELSLEDFNKKYLTAAIPVVLPTPEGFAPGCTIETLKKRFGKHMVTARIRTDTENYRKGTKYAIQRLRFEDYAKNLMKGNKKGRSSYMAAQNIPKTFPGLEKELPLPKYIGKKHNGPYMWLAHEGHYEFMHMDPDDNFLIILEGRKRICLFPPSPIRRMYPNPLGSKGKTIQSKVLLDEKQDSIAERFPEFDESAMAEVTVNAGEMLFIPAFFWHQVTTVRKTLSVNIFFGESGDSSYLGKIMRPPQWEAFSYWLLNILEQNAESINFGEIIREIPRVLEQFLMKQWHETPTEEQLARLVKVVHKRYPPQIPSDEEDKQQQTSSGNGGDAEKVSIIGVQTQRASKPRKRRFPPLLKIRGLKW